MIDNLTSHLTDIINFVTRKKYLTKENIKDSLNKIRASLIDADVPLIFVTKFLDNIQSQYIGHKISNNLAPSDKFIKIVHEELITILGKQHVSLNLSKNSITIIMVVGPQGCGKTTTVAKLAKWIKNKHKKSVLVTSTDIRRPGAREQLSILAKKISINDYYNTVDHNDPLYIAKNSIEFAKTNFIDCVIVDTAGCQHTDQIMIKEIKDIHTSIKPHETLLIVDSMMGQDTLNVTKAFAENINITGIIITKNDSDARGGAALTAKFISDKPIKFIGTGEKLEDLTLFYPERMASKILGMGDIVSLIEDANANIDNKKAQEWTNKFNSDDVNFNLDDFRAQLKQMRKIGGIKYLLSKLPHVMGKNITQTPFMDDKYLIKMEVIINSMTIKERHFPEIIKRSNRHRIAKGSGTNIQDVSNLLQQFEQMCKTMKQMKKFKMPNIIDTLQNRWKI